MASPRVELLGITGIGEVVEGEVLGTTIASACATVGTPLQPGDIVVISSKIISKAAGLWGADRVAAVADSTVRVVAERATFTGATRIVESVAGPVMAAGGVDASNVGGRDEVLLLPPDPDAAARTVHAELAEAGGLPVDALGVVVTDTAGRPWRGGQTDFALGLSGVRAIDDLRGGVDADGRDLAVTSRAVADEIAAAADLVKGKVDAIPVALVRGLPHLLTSPDTDGGRGRGLVRTGSGDWFALGHQEAVRAALGVTPGSSDSERIGFTALHVETTRDKVLRSVALARHGEADGPDFHVDPAGEMVTLTGENPYVTGRFVARLEVALVNEGLRVDDSKATAPDSVRIVEAD